MSIDDDVDTAAFALVAGVSSSSAAASEEDIVDATACTGDGRPTASAKVTP